MARTEKIEAYSLPGGVVMQLFREIGAGRPGLFTHVGLGTYVDPRIEGGRMNRCAKEDLVEVVQIDGQELLRYKPFPVHIAIIRGSYADAEATSVWRQKPPTSTFSPWRWPRTTRAAKCWCRCAGGGCRYAAGA